MTPIAQIIPGIDLPNDELGIYTTAQPLYLSLPTWKGMDGLRVSRWQLTWKERLQVLLGGSIWLMILTFGQPPQPMKLETTCPIKWSVRS